VLGSLKESAANALAAKSRVDDEELEIADRLYVSLSNYTDAETDELPMPLCGAGKIRREIRIAPHLFIE
jgi:hypothetical protein